MTEHAPRAAPDPSRRSFLKAVPALAVVAAHATAQASPPVAHATGAAASTGYHETEHIRRYYRTAAYW